MLIIILFFSFFQFLHGIEFTPFKDYARSVLTVNATATANYTCAAENVVQNRRTTDSRTFIVSVVHPVSRELHWIEFYTVR